MITSIQNDKIKRIYNLQHKTKVRKQEEAYIVEGYKMIQEAPIERVNEIYVTEVFLNKHESFINSYSNIKVEVVSEAVFKHISTSVTPQGILANIKQYHDQLDNILDVDNPLIIAADQIQDPGNMGTIIRTAEAAKATCVITSIGTVEIYNPKVIRATMGSIYRLPIITNVDLEQVIKKLKDKNINILAAKLEGSKYHYTLDLKKPTCFLIGNEGKGLSTNLIDLATEHVKIPMLGKAESLNAAISAGILLYEAVRQRMN